MQLLLVAQLRQNFRLNLTPNRTTFFRGLSLTLPPCQERFDEPFSPFLIPIRVKNFPVIAILCEVFRVNSRHLFMVRKPLPKLRRIGAKITPWYDVIVGRNVRLVYHHKDVVTGILDALQIDKKVVRTSECFYLDREPRAFVVNGEQIY